MTDFSPGMRVIIRDEEWMIKKVENNSLDRKTVYCTGISKLVKDHQAVFLTDLENIIPVDPSKIKLVADDSPFFIKSRLFIESQWRQLIPTDSALHIGGRAAMDLMNFQLDPAQLSLRRTRQRILIADTVGLGKTLEAGILMSELIIRGKGKRILVVTVKSMMTQFQKEMWNRFTIPLVRLDSNRIQRIRAQLPANYNPFFYYDKTIVSVDTLKRDLEYKKYLEDSWWDIIVIDEAHNVAERGSHQAQRARLAQLLAGRSDSLIMLSATPHDGKAESFASLMNMLDPTSVADPHDYIHDYNKEDIKGLCIRRFKKDIKDQVSGEFKERKFEIVECTASTAEEYAFEIFSEMSLQMDTGVKRGSGQLFKTGLEKSMFSSPAACIKSIDERIHKLEKRDSAGDAADIAVLRQLRGALEKITPGSFSRYCRLLDLLTDAAYGWNSSRTDDRVVVFTERIETMKFLSAQLRSDLNLKDSAVQVIYGGLSDIEQQKIVEDFGRADSPVRILVASDVASEGLNLHYLCHRLIHFDIPWSLMVFQQRNGRIDRYGQHEKPDIRYLMIGSSNKKIKGDMRIMEILVEKEEQAYKNIGDPAMLLGKFNVEEEEQVTAEAIEKGISADDFDQMLDHSSESFNPFELLMAGAGEDTASAEIHNDHTLFSDIGYLRGAMNFFGKTENRQVSDLSGVEGLEIGITPDLRRRLDALLPEEAVPSADYLRLSPDKQFCMDEMKRCMQNNMAETVWPAVQYLWPIHPIFNWVDDKSGLLFGRGEAPVVAIPGSLPETDFIFIIAGTFPNRKSTPVVDRWFGLRFSNSRFSGEMTMTQVTDLTGLHKSDMPNTNNLSAEKKAGAERLLDTAVFEAKKILSRYCEEYRLEIDPKIAKEKEKLSSLKAKHKEVISQLSFFANEKSAIERKVDRLFCDFNEWVLETLEIEDNPYLRVIAVVTGV